MFTNSLVERPNEMNPSGFCPSTRSVLNELIFVEWHHFIFGRLMVTSSLITTFAWLFTGILILISMQLSKLMGTCAYLYSTFRCILALMTLILLVGRMFVALVAIQVEWPLFCWLWHPSDQYRQAQIWMFDVNPYKVGVFTVGWLVCWLQPQSIA